MSLLNEISTDNLPTWPLLPAIMVACLLNYYSVYFGMLYWVSIGCIFVGIEFLFLSDFELLANHAIARKYVINGFLNILIASAIAQFIMAKKWRGKFFTKQRNLILKELK